MSIGRPAMDQACRRLRALHDANGGHDPIAISVNLSARQLQDPNPGRYRSLPRDIMRSS